MHWQHQHTILLKHLGDCTLLASTPQGDIYVEEFYDGEWIAQHCVNSEGQILKTIDENYGSDTFVPLSLPHDAQPQSSITSAEHALHRVGLRQRGLRETDRVTDWVKPLTIMQKMPLLAALNLSIPPMLLLGIAESHVLAEATTAPDLAIVCRRVSLAYALTEPQQSDDGLPYDYTTHTVHILHPYNHATHTAPDLHECLSPFHGVALIRPTDCLIHDNRLIVADSSDGNTPSRLHIWHTLN